MPELFFYRSIGGDERGPVTVADLGTLASTGQISAITQVRESGFYLWKYLADFQVLNSLLHQKQTARVDDPLAKALAQVTLVEIPGIIRRALPVILTVLFFVVHVPIVLSLVLMAIDIVLVGKMQRGLLAGMGHVSPISWTLPILCTVALCLGPLLAWFAYWRKRLSALQFGIIVIAAYVLPVVGMQVWSYRVGRSICVGTARLLGQ